MQLARISPVLLTAIIVAELFTCPFIRRTKKGILFAHYVFLHSIHSHETADNPDFTIGRTWTTVLLASSVFLMLVDHALTLNEKEYVFASVFNTAPFILLILVSDALAFVLYRYEFMIGNALFILGIIAVAIYLQTHPRMTTKDITIDGFDKIADGTFFYDLEKPFNCLGRHGTYHLFLIVLELVIGLSPYPSNEKIRNLFVIAETVSIWLIIVLPVITGGLVQTVKLVGRHIVEIQFHRQIQEAEKQIPEGKKPQREELLASIEEIYGEESIFPELT